MFNLILCNLLTPFLEGLPIFTKVPPSITTPKQHATFRVTCQAAGFPLPTLNWNRLRMAMPVGKTDLRDGTLTLRNLNPADSGLYECVATNSMGTIKTVMNMVVQQPAGILFTMYAFSRKQYIGKRDCELC